MSPLVPSKALTKLFGTSIRVFPAKAANPAQLIKSRMTTLKTPMTLLVDLESATPHDQFSAVGAYTILTSKTSNPTSRETRGLEGRIPRPLLQYPSTPTRCQLCLRRAKSSDLRYRHYPQLRSGFVSAVANCRRRRHTGTDLGLATMPEPRKRNQQGTSAFDTLAGGSLARLRF